MPASATLVTHSMGGLVAKQMLRHANSSPAYAAFAAAARGVVFLATPHTGADMAAFCRTLKDMLRTTAAIDDLQRNAAHLRDLNLWYSNWAHKTDIRNLVLFEAYPTLGLRIVDAGSADDQIPVDANHLTICKPDRRSAVVYGQVHRFVTIVCDTTTTIGLGTPPPQRRQRPTSPTPLDNLMGLQPRQSQVQDGVGLVRCRHVLERSSTVLWRKPSSTQAQQGAQRGASRA